jgi:hypothetical protein
VSGLIGSATARAADTVVGFTRDDGDHCCTLVESALDGTVVHTYVTDVPDEPYGTTHLSGNSASGAHDGTAVFTIDVPDGLGPPEPGAQYGIWVVAQGGQPRRLTTSYLDEDPVISPDGSKVAFARWNPLAYTADIYVMNSDGTGLRQLTHASATTALYKYPEFAPDSGSIAYSCGRGGYVQGPMDPLPCGPAVTGDRSYFGLMLMADDGSDQRMIVENLSGPTAWSPDGRSLVAMGGSQTAPVANFATYRSDGGDLYTPDAAPVLIAGDDLLPWPPSFSPDGTEVMVIRAPSATGWPNTQWLVPSGGGPPQRTGLIFESSSAFVPAATGGGPPPTSAPNVHVPGVEGKSFASAKAQLRARHLRLGRVVRVTSKRVARGHVIRQVPRGGKVRRAGSKVQLVVSRGRRR